MDRSEVIEDAKAALAEKQVDRANGTCPLGHKMVRREAMFFWRGDYRPGWVCETCSSLWTIPGEEIEPLRPAPSG